MEKTKVLYYNSTLKKGGTDIYMLGVVKNLDKEKFAVDVLIKDGDTIDNSMLSDLENDGHKVFLAHGSFMKRMLFLKKFFKQHKNQYDVCHINATSQSTGIISYFAKKYGKIKKIIFHSHMSGNDNGITTVDKIGKRLMFKFSTNFVSCSNLASKFMFFDKKVNNRQVLILNNFVDTDKFNFNKKTREKIRKELNIAEDEFTIIHIGRFAKQKNHAKLLEIFAKVEEMNPKSKLIMIGSGELFEETKTLAVNLNIDKNCLFLGLKDNVYDYMQAGDCFVMPSIHEGLPIVAVEAQTSGLPCVLSSNISSQTKLTDDVTFIGLDEPLENWSKMILSFKTHKRNSNKQILVEKGFDKNTAIKEIEKLYLE